MQFSHPKEEAIKFEDASGAMNYSRGGAKRFWQKVSVGTTLTGPRGVVRQRAGRPHRSDLNFERAAERLDELLGIGEHLLTDAERAETESLTAFLLNWERVPS